MKQIFNIFIILLLLQNVANRKKSRAIYFLETKMDWNPKFVKYVNVDISKDKTSMNILFETSVNVTQFWGTSGVSVWQKNSQAYHSIITHDMDYCEMLERLRSFKMELLKNWLSNILKYGNLTARCPILKNVYYIDNLKVERHSIPDYAPAGKFQTSIAFYNKDENDMKETIGTSLVTVELK